MVDYNAQTGQFSNWTSFDAPGGTTTFTHFEGISNPSPGVYTLSADSGSGSSVQGWWVTVQRLPSGGFSQGTWIALDDADEIPDGFLSDNSVAGNQVVGIASTSAGIVPYQATVNMPTTS